MREVLFRGKRTDNGTWTCGYLFCIWERAYLCWGTTNNVPNMKEVLPETVCQFTGLYDKNGRKIFEGDIVNFYNGDGEFSPYEVRWQDSAFLVLMNGKPNLFDVLDDFSSRRCEIIGNIYDNPELLTEWLGKECKE